MKKSRKEADQPSPFLKWVGGKRQIIPAITRFLPPNLDKLHYLEPFIGGGAMLFHLRPNKALINDFNPELINVYEVIRDEVDALIKDLKKHKNEADYFYRVREWDRNGKIQKLSRIQRASRVIFLNKTCFNGLYRVNASGEFNVPFGRYKNPNIVNENVLRAVSRFLNESQIEIRNGDYAEAVKAARRNSFVYFDPPYHPLSPTSSFTGYITGGWGDHDQIRLKQVCDDLHRRGVKFLLSNSSTPFIRTLYQEYHVHIIKAGRAINAVASKRGAVDEVLVANYQVDLSLSS